MDASVLVIVLLVVAGVLGVGVVCLIVLLVAWRSSAGSGRRGRGEALLAAERELIEQEAIRSERTRILREMHDIIAHSLAIMVAQADGGSYAAADPVAAKRAFTTIAETGRAAVDETRRILGMLKRDPEDPVLTPVPDQFSVDSLIQRSRESGMDVCLIRIGAPRLLPAGLGLILYRICQEALTNVMKHAGDGAQTTVTENWRADDVVVTITDQYGRAPTTAAPGSGQGILGMRERASIVGGTLSAEPYEDGFRVRMVLPLPQEPALVPDEGGSQG
ncbi:MAG: histidine kinase [Propionibacteriaceae bacterium]|nr:histidine kinase [Propionibacteriaceae bacterium]